MEWLIVLIIIGSIVSAISGFLFWGGLVWFGVKAAKRAGGGFAGPMTPFPGMDPQFFAAMEQIQRLIAQAQTQRLPQTGARGGGAALPPHVQQQFNQQLLRAQRQLAQLDDLRRQQHDTFVSGMLGDAAAAGLDVTSWR